MFQDDFSIINSSSRDADIELMIGGFQNQLLLEPTIDYKKSIITYSLGFQELRIYCRKLRRAAFSAREVDVIS